MNPAPEELELPSKSFRNLPLPWLIVGGTALVMIAGTWLAVRAANRQNTVSLSQAPKRVGTVAVKEAIYRVQHRYVGTLLAWDESKLGPQFISGYLTEVRVRPGALVRKGEVLAVIEPERAKAQNTVSTMQAAAIQAKLSALAKESERIQGLQKKGIVSENEAENKLAEVMSEKARLEAAKAQMASTDVEYQDTVQRAPFDGEVSERYLDPGAFVRPGSFILSVVNRTRIRCAADAPEGDHPFLTVGRPVHLGLLADGRQMEAKITRVSPAADPSTRTIHFELDLDNQDRSLPTGTTAEMLILEAGGRKVIQLSSAAAQVEGKRATVFVVDGDRVHKKVLQFLGERDGQLYLSPDLPEGTQVVLDGRAQLEDGDRILAGPAQSTTPEPGARP
jgi:membrane fusion protein, multidrug efflux system